MKRNILIAVLTVVCLVAMMLPRIRQVEAKTVKSHIPQVTLYIRQNPLTKQNYFTSRPAFLCVRGRVASITIKNMTKQPQVIDWWGFYKFVTIKPGKSITSTQHATDQGVDNPDYEIVVALNYKPSNPPEAVADIIADGVVKGCM